jgi:uncharacterized protein involved in propanediol utilization
MRTFKAKQGTTFTQCAAGGIDYIKIEMPGGNAVAVPTADLVEALTEILQALHREVFK